MQIDELAPSLRYCAYNIGDETAIDDLLQMRGTGMLDNLDTLLAQARLLLLHNLYHQFIIIICILFGYLNSKFEACDPNG